MRLFPKSLQYSGLVQRIPSDLVRPQGKWYDTTYAAGSTVLASRWSHSLESTDWVLRGCPWIAVNLALIRGI